MKNLISIVDGSDVLTFGGLALAGVGIGMVSVPVALIVVGMALFALGVFTTFPVRVNKK